MKYLTLLMTAAIFVGCSGNYHDYSPSEISLTPSCECEIQEGQAVKTKPKVQMNINWKL